MIKVFGRPASLTDKPLSFCPGCTHGIVHRLVAECLDELSLREKTIGIAPVGCAVTSYNFFAVDMQQAAHGRAPAVATGIKRVLPDRIVFGYQGDGDLASIGMAEIVHAAARGEKITVIFINNAIYGMTGGQMAPTTLIGQKTTTSPLGRDPEKVGHPIRICELLATLPGATYLARVSVHDPKHVGLAKAAIKKAFQVQVAGQGFSLVEVLSSCPTNWGMTPFESLKWIEENMVPYYPLGTFRQPEEASPVGA